MAPLTRSRKPGEHQFRSVRRSRNGFLSPFALIPARYFLASAGMGPADYLPFVTNMFLHVGWLHLILNMWSLWIFGAAVEDRLGPVP